MPTISAEDEYIQGNSVITTRANTAAWKLRCEMNQGVGEENARLKRMYAERRLHHNILMMLSQKKDRSPLTKSAY